MKEHESVNKLLAVLKKDKIRNVVVLVGIIGILLIYLSTLFSSPKDPKPPQEDTPASAPAYEEALELRLQQIVTAITGEASPGVMVTLMRDTEYIYAADEKNQRTENYHENETQKNHDTEKSFIILKDADGNQHALTVTEVQPEVKGVVIVSSAANQAVVQEKIVNAVKTALGVSSSKICVVTGSGDNSS